jgi:hypothetical protein
MRVTEFGCLQLSPSPLRVPSHRIEESAFDDQIGLARFP